jgi:hypothetical protein
MGILISENGNEKSPIHVVLAVKAKEIYKMMSCILDAMRCKENIWQFCADLKISAFGWTTGWIYQVWFLPQVMGIQTTESDYNIKNLTAEERSFLG